MGSRGLTECRSTPARPWPAVFLDRDGVLNRTVIRGGVPRPPQDATELELLPGVTLALDELARAGFALVVVTNQPDVARGTQTRAGVAEINARMRRALPVLRDVLVCYHDDADCCTCRKPKPGMILEAAARWRLDLHGSFMVGDRWSDVVAGQAAGCRTVLVETAYSGRERCRPDATAGDLTEAAEWIIRTYEERKHEALRRYG